MLRASWSTQQLHGWINWLRRRRLSPLWRCVINTFWYGSDINPSPSVLCSWVFTCMLLQPFMQEMYTRLCVKTSQLEVLCTEVCTCGCKLVPIIWWSPQLCYNALVIFPCYVLYIVLNLHHLVSNLQKCSELECAVQGKGAVERQCSKWKVDCEELKAEVSSTSYTQY